jgi:hypothetical protein
MFKFKTPTAASKVRTLRMQNLLRDFGDASVKKHKTYAFSAGYMESTVLSMFAEMTKAQQEHWLECFQERTADMLEA